MVRTDKFFAPIGSLFILLFLFSCGKVDTPNVADPFANITGKSLGFDVNPPFFEKDASGNQKGLDSAVPGSCGNILLQWSKASDDVSLPENISYEVYQARSSGSEDFSKPTYQVPAGVLQFLVKNLSPGTAYYFVVRARDEAGNLSVIDPNRLIERSATTAGTRAAGAGPNLYCPGGYAGESVVLTGISAGSATTAIFPPFSSTTSVPVTTGSTTEARAIIPSGIQSGSIQLAPAGGTISDRFFFFPPGINVSSDPTDSTHPSIAVSGTRIGMAWTDSYNGKGRILFSLSTNGGATFATPIAVSDSSRFSSSPQLAFGSGTAPPIYLAWADLDAEGNNSDIYFSRSLTNGSSFSTPVNLSLDAGDSLHPRLVSSGNNLSVVWDDRSVLYGLTSVWGSSLTDVYAVGKGGNIYHSTDQGKKWLKQFSNTTVTLSGIWGSGGSDVYAVGSGGMILHYAATASGWSTTRVGSANLNAVWGSGPGDIYAVGSGGTILHYNGTAWSSATVGSANLNGVWGSGPGDIYAVGTGGTILHYNGTGWSSSTIGTANLNAVWGSGPADVYIVGDRGTILYSTNAGLTWSLQTVAWPSQVLQPPNLNSIWGTIFTPSGSLLPEEVIYAGGTSDKIIKKINALPWDATSVAISGAFTVTGLWGIVTPTASNIYGVQGNGPVFQWNGANWQYLNPETTSGEIFYLQSPDGGATFNAPVFLSTASASNHSASAPDLIQSGNNLTVTWTEIQTGIVAAGGAGAILTSSYGNTWTAQAAGSNTLNSLAWSGARLVAVGGSGLIATSSDGNSWTTQTSTTTNSLNSVAWSGSQFVAVGGNGTILTSPDGNSWTPQIPVNANPLNGIAGTPTQWVAVGGGGMILTSTYGNTWTSQKSTTSNSLNAVVWSGDQLIAVGAGGTILTSSYGTTWTAQTPVTSNSLNGIAWSGTQFAAVGGSGTILTSNDGKNWVTQTPVTSNSLNNIIWDGAEFIAVGGGGTILTSTYGTLWTPQTPLTTQPLNGIALTGSYANIHAVQSSDGVSFSAPAILPLQNSSFSSNQRLAVGGGTVFMVWEDHASLSNQIRIVQFPIAGLSNFPSSKVLSASGTASHPSVTFAGNTLVAVWTDTLQQKRDGNAVQSEIFFLSSPDGGVSFTPPGNFSSPFQDMSDNPVLVNDGSNIFIGWQQQMPPAGNLPQNSEVFFSKF